MTWDLGDKGYGSRRATFFPKRVRGKVMDCKGYVLPGQRDRELEKK